MSNGYEQYDDTELVRACRRGIRDAFGTLVDRHLRSVYSVVFRIVGSEADAEDLSQETFLRAFDRLESYNEKHLFRNWLLKIATNLALSHLRTQRRHKRLEQDFALAGIKSEPNEISDSQDDEQYRYFLDQLDADQRTAIVLFHFEEMSYTEVARIMNLPLNTVRTLLHRGRQRLRELMRHRASIMEMDI